MELLTYLRNIAKTKKIYSHKGQDIRKTRDHQRLGGTRHIKKEETLFNLGSWFIQVVLFLSDSVHSKR